MFDDIAYTYKADILCKTCGHEAQNQVITNSVKFSLYPDIKEREHTLDDELRKVYTYIFYRVSSSAMRIPVSTYDHDTITNTAMVKFREWLGDNPEKYDSDDYPKVFLISQSGAVDCSVCYQCGDPVEVCLDTCTIESCIVCSNEGA